MNQMRQVRLQFENQAGLHDFYIPMVLRSSDMAVKTAMAGLTCLSFRRGLCLVISVCMAVMLLADCTPSAPVSQPPSAALPSGDTPKETPSSIVLVYHTPEPSATRLPTDTPGPTNTPNRDPAYFYGSLTINLDYAGQTVDLKRGESFLLDLSQFFTWQISFDPVDLVSRNMKITPEPGQQGVFVARKRGKTTMQAIGEPVCRQENPPCSRPAVLFSVNLVVK